MTKRQWAGRLPVDGLARPSPINREGSEGVLFLGKNRNMRYVFPLRRIQTRVGGPREKDGLQEGDRLETLFRGGGAPADFFTPNGRNPLKRPDSKK
jgi:hypothetical protein